MLTVTPDVPWPTRLTVVSDKRKHAAVAEVLEHATITVSSAGETKAYDAVRVVTPAVPASVDPITIADPRGGVWTRQGTDDGITAVYAYTA